MFSHLNTHTIGKFYISKLPIYQQMIFIFNFHMKDVLFLILKQVLHDDILNETEILAKHHRDVVPRKLEGLNENYS